MFGEVHTLLEHTTQNQLCATIKELVHKCIFSAAHLLVHLSVPAVHHDMEVESIALQ